MFIPFIFKTIYYYKIKIMNVNINHPSFISFINQITTNILNNVTINNYFLLQNEKKIVVQYTVLKLMRNSLKMKAKITDSELRSFVTILWKKNEEMENYELASILNDINNNFDKINESTIPKKRNNKQIKIEDKG